MVLKRKKLKVRLITFTHVTPLILRYSHLVPRVLHAVKMATKRSLEENAHSLKEKKQRIEGDDSGGKK